MLEPRESDIPALILVLVVLPLVSYILLGKWSEIARKRNRINLLAQLATEEALKTDEMAVADVIPPISSSKNGFHVCARCSSPARTRCSKCKSVRYCSGNCQIIHWRQIHQKECQQLESQKSNLSSLAGSVDEFSQCSGSFYVNVNSQFFGHNMNHHIGRNASLNDSVHPPTGTNASTMTDYAMFNNSQVSTLERRTTYKSNRDIETINDSSIESLGHKASFAPSSSMASKEFMRPKSRNNDYAVLEEEPSKKSNSCISGGNNAYRQGASRTTIVEGDNYQNQLGHGFTPRNNYRRRPILLNEANNCKAVDEFETDTIFKDGNVVKGGNHPSNETAQFKCSSEMTTRSIKDKKISHPPKARCSKSSKSTSMASANLCCADLEKKGKITDESNAAGMGDTNSSQCNNVAGNGFMNMVSLRNSVTISALSNSKGSANMCKEIKILFPYEEFVKLFQSDAFSICPRGLLNCGNSCYANAVLQCLTCTKPLAIFLLCRSHSKACSAKDWCLMCELEHHIMMLRENGGPLSISRILGHMRSMNCQMVDGSQEDAHEFLRLLVASMQSICLEGVGGEKKVNPRLQETTFVQHTFGGRLLSKVKCLNCNHESERYENIMDLTLEILGWVGSLEDALTQFTSPEYLDGENMYRCLRCTAYVRARKQLSIHEAPNILTIVLKRFQEGRYGKINKCITFPEMLDMIPFMTGTGDIPPLYMLYAVVVHLDTLNASFSGHYVSYVKDLQGNWFRIDDTEVQPVPTSQVMSEGAYILFYMRSFPRPEVAFTGKAVNRQVSNCSQDYPIEPQKPSKPRHSRQGSKFVDIPHDILRRRNVRNVLPVTETSTSSIRKGISDAPSSDWSFFTSSDEASFTTESTRDSFSTVDYADSYNMDPLSSIFNSAPENSRDSIRDRKYSRFFSEKGYEFDSSMSKNLLETVQRINQTKKVSHSSIEPQANGNCGMHVYHRSSTPVCDIRTD